MPGKSPASICYDLYKEIYSATFDSAGTRCSVCDVVLIEMEECSRRVCYSTGMERKEFVIDELAQAALAGAFAINMLEL